VGDFNPEKGACAGLQFLSNFVNWLPSLMLVPVLV